MKLYLVQKLNKTPYLQANDLLWLQYIQVITGRHFPHIKNLCDINCGDGKMLCALACLYPEIAFTGICLSTEHLKNAQQIKTSLSLNNIRFFYLTTIGEISKLDLPLQNLVCLNDTWNFCDEEERKLLANFINTADIAVVSYDALPGHASIVPIHRTLINHKNTKKNFHYINQHYGSYFQAHPVAGMLINEDMNRYAHPKWSPQSVDQVSQYFTAPLMGEFPIHRNYPYVGMSKKEKELFSTINDPVYFSTMRDYVFNTTKRIDIYAKALAKKTPDFSCLSFGQVTSQKSFPDKVVKGRVTFLYQKPIFKDIFALTQYGFVSYSDLKENLSQYSEYEVAKALHELIAGETLQVSFLPLKAGPPIKSLDFKGKIKFVHPFNKHICDNLPMDGNIFIEPKTKTIIPIEGMESALLQAITKVSLPLAAQICAENFRRETPQSHILGKSCEQITRNFLIALDRLKTKYLPKLIEMGIVEILD